jgi:hypothetical protein
MDSYFIKKNYFRQDLSGFYFIISSFLKKLEIHNPPRAEFHFELIFFDSCFMDRIIVTFLQHILLLKN